MTIHQQHRQYKWSPASRAAMSQRMAAIWQKRRADGFASFGRRIVISPGDAAAFVPDPKKGLGHLDRGEDKNFPRSFAQSWARARRGLRNVWRTDHARQWSNKKCRHRSRESLLKRQCRTSPTCQMASITSLSASQEPLA